MAYLGVWGAMILLLAILALIILCLYKEWVVPALVLGVMLIIAIPIWLDRLILHQWYVVIPWESSREPKEWMDFLGSYLGVVGTIVVGALAYWQTRVTRQQDKKIAELQDQITMYKVCPVIYFKDGTMKVYAGKLKRKMNRNIYNQIHYSLCGKLPSDDVLSFVHIIIPFQEKGFVPIEKVYLKELKWSIDDKTYVIALKDDKYTIMGEQLQILIDCSDDITKEDCGASCEQDFIDAIIKHQEYYGTGDYNYDKSHLMLKLQFVNQMGNLRNYELIYYIYSDQSREQLCLINPHIGITGEDNR